MATSDQELATAFSALHREISALYSRIARRFGLTPQQIELLCHLNGHRPSFGELASALGCDKTNVTGMVDRMERRGLLAREIDPTDRRITRAVLTEQGLGMRQEIGTALQQELAARLPATGRAKLVALLNESVLALAEGRSGNSPVR